MLTLTQQQIVQRVQTYMIMHQCPPPLHLSGLTHICKRKKDQEFMDDLAIAWAVMFGAPVSSLQ